MDLRLRRGTDRDAVAVSALYLRVRKAAKATIPMAAHTDDEVRRWIAERVVPHAELWVAEDDGGALVGLLVLDAAAGPVRFSDASPTDEDSDAVCWVCYWLSSGIVILRDVPLPR